MILIFDLSDLGKVLVSSVIRASSHGESHGGLYLVDLESEEIEQVLDWDEADIDWKGRGGERGLRGIEFYDDKIIVAGANKLQVFDQNWNTINSFSNIYLEGIHETTKHGNSLFITSTYLSCIIEFDLSGQQFLNGYFINPQSPEKGSITKFDPKQDDLDFLSVDTHINTVNIKNGDLYFSGTNTEFVFVCEGDEYVPFSPIPRVTHNVYFFRDGLIFNNTKRKRIEYFVDGSLSKKFPRIKEYSMSKMEHAELSDEIAEQAWGRGLDFKGNFIVGGSSPATISVYEFESERVIKTINISKDIRNAVHGLEFYPYS